MFPINQHWGGLFLGCHLTLHSTMFPINPQLVVVQAAGIEALHSTMFPINRDSAYKTTGAVDVFTFHYVSY